MAYTKAPTQDTHNVVRIPVEGSPMVVSGTSTTNNSPVTLACIDCYPIAEKQWGTDPKRSIVKRDGFTALTVSGTTTTTNQFNGSIVVSQLAGAPNIFFGKGTTHYMVDCSALLGSASTVSAVTTGFSFASSTGTLGVNASNVSKVCWLNNASLLVTFNEDGTTVATTDLSALGVTGYRGIVFLNGYLFAATPEAKIYNSGAAGALTTWASTDFIVPEMIPDALVWIAKYKNYLLAAGTESIEFFYDASIEVGSPLARQETYQSKIGAYRLNRPGSQFTYIDDDLYFIGKGDRYPITLCRVKDFKVEAIESHFIADALNWNTPSLSVSARMFVESIETLIIGSDPMVLITLTTGLGDTTQKTLVYNPGEDVFWYLSTDSDATIINSDIPGWRRRINTFTLPNGAPPQTAILANTSTTSAAVEIVTVDLAGTVTVTASTYSQVIDLGINREKQAARIDAIGDYGTNSLTLAYNMTPNYAETYTNCTPTQVPSTNGYDQNISWYNLGPFRRMSLKFTMAGTSPAVHEGFDLEYNIGAA